MIRAIRMAILRRRMRYNADRLDWLDDNVRFGLSEIRRTEEAQRRLQAQAWAIERPRDILRRTA